MRKYFSRIRITESVKGYNLSLLLCFMSVQAPLQNHCSTCKDSKIYLH